MDKDLLSELYLNRCMSMQEIASSLDISVSKVHYWLKKHSIATRSYSDASYVKYNGTTDPFIIKAGLTLAEENLKGLGIGIYWGEGN